MDLINSAQKPLTHGEATQAHLKDFLLLFLPICFLILLSAWLLGISNIKSEQTILKSNEKSFVNLSQGRLDHDLAIPIRHLISLTNEEQVRQVYQGRTESEFSPMEHAFMSMVSRNPSYDTVRWIDEKGLERVRVNRKNDIPYLVLNSELQDKHNRYYFTQTMQLSNGEIFISPLDLNIENGKIEIPYNPTIRIASPVFNEDGESRGMLVINFAANAMLNNFVASAGPAAERLMLLNADGYWLKSSNAADEWGFMFKRPVTLGNRNLQAWNNISKSETGQVRLSDGLWTWGTVNIIPEGRNSLSNIIHWKVASHLPESTFVTIETRGWLTSIACGLGLILLFGFGVYKLVQAKNAQAQAEKAISLERAKAESAFHLQQANARFQMLFKANNSGLAVVDKNGLIVMANPALETMFGYQIAELMNQPVDILIPDQKKADHFKHLAAYFSNPSIRPMEGKQGLLGVHKEGNVFPIDVGLSPFQENNQDFVLATVVDITERKQFQDELLKMNDKLEQRVTERTAELQAARLEAERLANIKGDFLANMSHEIRTPMNAIIGLAYLLDKAKLDPEQQTLVKKIRIASRSLLGIINDILDFSKIESGRLELEKTPFRLSDVLDNVATLMSAVEYSSEVELIMSPVPKDMEFLRGDSLRLEQILINLTTNALKFTQRGTVLISMAEQPRDDEKRYLRFSVSDTGKGIAQDKQYEIFNSFSQEDTSTTRNFGGSGLGLAICKHLVKLMGGEIDVISELGKGSEFWFELPVELIQSQDYLNQDLVFQNVMIVDDHPVAREMLAGMVRSLGWSADVAASGEEAITKIKYKAQQNKLPDLLLLDWRMPEMNGIEVGQKIKQILGNTPNQPIIFLATAQDRDQLLQEEGVEMASSVLSKPITASVLYNVMTEVKNIQKAEINSGVDSTTNDRLLNLRVLIVDDSELNLDMARRILESEGATIELANDGESALEWLNLNADRIDVVLMDIQMPLMDGYQATHEIRETLGLTSLPVIALTAGAFKNQQEAALSAGMNGFIAKPFDVDELVSYLQQYLRTPDINKNTGLTASESNDPSEISEISEISETSLIDWQRGLRNWKKAEDYYKYLHMFANAHGQDGDEINELITQDRLNDARSLAHKLKGTAGNLAIMGIWELAEKVETTLVEGIEATDLAHELQKALDSVSDEINRFKEASQPNNITTPSVTEADTAIKLLEDLLLLLDRDNPDAAQSILSEIEKFLPKTMLTPIQEQLDNFNFRSAEEKTNALIKQLS